MSDQEVAVRPEQAVAEGQGPLLSAIVHLAKDPTVDVAKLQALLEMQERLEERQAQVSFNRALARLPKLVVKKNGLIDLGKGKAIPFARWEDMAAVIEPALVAEGFRLMFDTAITADGRTMVIGHLLHADGHSRSATLPLPADTGPGRNSLQAVGSTLSYGKRYCTEMLLNVIREGEDDDGRTGGTPKLTPNQVSELINLIVDTHTDTRRFLDTMVSPDCRALEDVDAREFVRLRNALEQKKRRDAANASAATAKPSAPPADRS